MPLLATGRSSRWPEVRAAYLKKFPACAVCGHCDGVEVHHKRPYHLFPDLELVEGNLVTLCEGRHHHLIFGHCGDFRAWNPDVDADIVIWFRKFRERPHAIVVDAW